MSDHFSHIGQAARETGLSPPTIRYYEQIGLLPPPVRGENGYRLYSQDDLARLRFVRRARLLDLALEEIRDIMAYALDGRCGSLQQYLVSLLEAKIAEVDERIRELGSLRADLETFHRALAIQPQMSVNVSSGLADDARYAAPHDRRLAAPHNRSFCACLDKPGR